MNPAASSNTIEIAASEFDGLSATTDFYLRITQPDLTYVYHDMKTTPYQFSITADIISNTDRFAIVFVVPPGGIMIKNVMPASKFVVTCYFRTGQSV